MLHEQIVRAVVGDVVEGDEQAEGGEHKAHHDLGVPRDEHGAASFALAAQRASLASVSRQTGVSLLIFSLRQVMARPAPYIHARAINTKVVAAGPCEHQFLARRDEAERRSDGGGRCSLGGSSGGFL